MSKINSSNNNCLIPKDSSYTDINGWLVSIKLPKDICCNLLEYFKCILNKQENAFYKLDLYLAYKITDEINYALLCTRKTTNPIEEKICIVIVNNTNIIDIIPIYAKRIIRYENEYPSDCCGCYPYKNMEYGIPKYYYLTNCNLWAVYSCENSIPITISTNALRLLYNIIESYFMPIYYTNECLSVNNNMGLRAYPTAVNNYIIGPTS